MSQRESAASAILILSRSPEGDEHIRHMLVGNILLVTTSEILKMALVYSVVGAIHWIFRQKFILISTHADEAFRCGISVKWWDLLFYLTFGFVVTSSVQVAGVLLVFSYLIVPAVAAMLLAHTFQKRLLAGWILGMFASIFGIGASYFFDLPTGATVVCTFGGILTVVALLGCLGSTISKSAGFH
ncbi:MAG: metal ABC transporter permease [Candidatus Omnitrophica bacterium]|nr:metal ABC transporter permease [Candidatus Omnitrophota bacterium]